MADVLVVNTETGESERRPLTAEEQAQRDADAQAAADAEAAEAQAQADAEAAEQAWLDAVTGASSWQELRDAIAGKGLPARAESRPTT